MSDWFSQARRDTDTILTAIKAQPFIKELIDGSMRHDVFQFYVNQDALYLTEYKKALAMLAIKCNELSESQFFLESATGIIAVENALHAEFLEPEFISNEPSPSCELYTSYLARMTNAYSLEEGLAAVLPCFTIYKEIGDYILHKQDRNQANAYQKWIDTYASDEFAEAVNQAVAITNKYADKASAEMRQKMFAAFEKSSKLEWIFWDSAYRQEQWPL